jgi:hypothetical protein
MGKNGAYIQEMRIVYRDLVKKSVERNEMYALGVDVRILLKQILQKQGVM